MKSKLFFILLILILLALVNIVSADLTCTITSSCSDTVLLYLENEIGGSTNAHAQLANYTPTYSNSVCCNTTGQSISSNCTDGTVFLRLSDITNAHVQDPNNGSLPTIYANEACINTQGISSCTIQSGSCSGTSECLASIASSEGNDYTNAHIGECGDYTLQVCCDTNSPPPVPVPDYPDNEDYMFINRTPFFNWTFAGDADGDPVTFHFELFSDSSLTVIESNQTALANLNYTHNSILDFQSYYWKVRAYDGQDYSAWSATQNFTIQEYVAISLLNADMQFSTFVQNQTDDTTDNTPTPFTIRSFSNTEIDIYNTSANESLWSTQTLNSQYWRIKGRTGSNSYNESGSITSWTNVLSGLPGLINRLNWTVDRDALIDIEVTVPFYESPGTKQASIIFDSEVAS